MHPILWACLSAYLVHRLLGSSQGRAARTTETARNPVVIDHEYFPHIMEVIIAYAPPKSLAVLSSTSRAYRKRLGFATHAKVIASCYDDEEVWFRFSAPGNDTSLIPHLRSRFALDSSVDEGPVAVTDPLVAEVFKRFRFVDMELHGGYSNVCIPQGIEPEYIRMSGLCTTANISRVSTYTVLVGSQGQNLNAYPRGMLPPCPCHTASLTVVLESHPCDPDWCPWDDPRVHWHYVLHYAGPDARESSRLSSPPPVASTEHPKVAVGTLSQVDDLYVGESEYYAWGSWPHTKPEADRAWMERLWKKTTRFEQLSLEEFASANGLSQAEINFERGVKCDIYKT